MEGNENKDNNVPSSKDKLLLKVCFCFFGIATLLFFNAVLINIDYFNKYQNTFFSTPSVIYPFLNFILNIVFQCYLICTKIKLSYKSLLLFTFVFQFCSVIIVPIIAICLKAHGRVSFILTGIIVFIQGLICAICTFASLGLVSLFATEYIVALSIGQSIAGLTMNIFKFIVLLVFPNNSERNETLGLIVFFIISALIMVMCVILLRALFKNEYFLSVLNNSNNDVSSSSTITTSVKSENKLSDSDNDNTDDNAMRNVDIDKLEVDLINNNKNEGAFAAFVYLFKQIKDINILIFILYTITFTIYPGACLIPDLFKMNAKYVAWKTNIILTSFNTFDTIGREIVKYMTPKKLTYYILTYVRFIFLILVPLAVYLNQNNHDILTNIILIFNVPMIAFTSGVATSLGFALAPLNVDNNLKSKAGGSVAFFNILGIFCGSCLAFAMEQINNYIQS